MATPRRDGEEERPTDPRRGGGPVRRPEGARQRARRLAGLAATAVLAALTLTACGEDKPYTTVDPATGIADDIQGLYKLVFWMALVVFVGVQFLIFYTALRFRQKRRLADRPEQIHGNSRLEITWTIVPAIVLLIIFVPTVVVMYDAAAEADDEEGAFVVDVHARQWWWEITYPEIPDANGEPLLTEPLITANEVRLPVGQKVIFRMFSNNVIHSFWVPQLSGKMDVTPGYANTLGFTPEIPGEYYGECAEFCGTAHAWMRFKVIVEPREQFEAWVAAWSAGPSDELAQAPDTFGVCTACHRANGSVVGDPPRPADSAPIGYESPYNMGPNLTLFGCRETLGAGVAVNNRDNLIAWLLDPHNVKEGNLMGYAIGPEGQMLQLSPEQAAELADYLLNLKLPDGTCPPDPDDPSPATGGTADLPADPAAGDVVAAAPEGQ